MSNKHQDKGLGYSLERDRTQHMDQQSLEAQVNRSSSTPIEAAAARDELLDRQDGK